jgi:hypothetical protein
MTVVCLRGEGFNVFRVQEDTATATGNTADTVTDSAKAWTPNEWQDHAVKFTSGNHNGRSYNIVSNTADTLTCTIPLGSSVSGENIGTGDGGTVAFNGTLDDPVDTGTLSITDTVETFTDPLNDGVLVGDAGGTGTITYTTGAWAVTFNAAPAGAQAITADYDPMFNFNCDSGVAVADTFEIIEQGADLVQNATPPGSADLTDQAVSTIAVMENEGFYLYLDPTGGATFTVTALVGNGVEDNTESWTTDEWIGSMIEFTSGVASGQSFFISSNTNDDIYSLGISFSAAGVLVNDTFKITHTFFREVLNATPGGSADLTDQPIITTVDLSSEGFFIFVSARLPGITYEVTALVNHGVTSSGAGWTLDDWVGYRIEFTDGALNGNDYVICHNSAANIFGQSINFAGAGVLVGDHFKITAHFIDLTEDTTPPGSADPSDQGIAPVAVMEGEGFYIFVSPYGAPATIYEISSLIDGGLKVADINWTTDVFATGYRIEFTDGVLSGLSFVVSSNTKEEMYSAGINFSDEGVLAGDHFKLTLDYIDLKEKKWLLLHHHRMTGGLTHRSMR